MTAGTGPGTQRGQPRLQRVHLLDGDVGRQLGEMALQLGQRNLALAVADDDVVDRNVADQSRGALLLLGQQRFDPGRRSLGDEDDAGPADHPVHRVEVAGGGHTRA